MAAATLAGGAHAQSLSVRNPAPLQLGPNRATTDSFVGSQFWQFTLAPGRFRLVFSGSGPQEGFSVGGRAVAGMAFAPSSPTSHFTTRETPQGTVFEGSVAHVQRVVVEVDPAKSPLVRQTTEYTLTLSAALADTQGVGGGGGGGGPPGGQIVGVYISKINDAGAVRFTPDGQIIASNGARGSWTLFDPDSRIYSLTLGGQRLTVTLQPGRGLIDSGNRNLIFEAQR